MTPERKRYAEKRVARLTARIDHNQSRLIAETDSDGPHMEEAEAQVVRRQLHNDRQAIKRWKKELAAHAQKKRADSSFLSLRYCGDDPFLSGHGALGIPAEGEPGFYLVQTSRHTNHPGGSWVFGWHRVPVTDWKEAE